jgi:hypothetical protein
LRFKGVTLNYYSYLTGVLPFLYNLGVDFLDELLDEEELLEEEEELLLEYQDERLLEDEEERLQLDPELS